MSYRRSLSFSETEDELVQYFDQNGKSEIAKTAMKFYKENKSKVFIDSIKDLIHLITQPQQPIQQRVPASKMQRLIK